MTTQWWQKIKEYIGNLDEGYAEGGKTKPPQKWNDLLVRIAREIEQTMLSEMFEPPGEPTYIPPEYIVFLNPTDDAALQGDKRVGFLRGLRNITAERAKQIVAAGRTQTDKFCVEFRVDGSLAEDEFYVKASWDVESDPTTVRMVARRSEPDLPSESLPVGEMDETTEVRRRPLFRLDIQYHNDPQPTSHQIFSREVRIGRGGQNVPVDVALGEDREISRIHAILRTTSDGYEVVMRGKNPMSVSGRELQLGESARVSPGEPIQIGLYTLHIVAETGASDAHSEREGHESIQQLEPPETRSPSNYE